MRDPVALEHYHLTRNFAIGALAVVVLAAAGLAYASRSVSLAQLRRMADDNNAALTQTFANVLWPRYRLFLSSTRDLSAEEIRRHPRTADLAQAVERMIAGTRVLEVKLYDLKGRVVFSTTPEEIGASLGENPRFLAAAAGEPVAELEVRARAGASDGPGEALWGLSSYLPVRPAGRDGEIEGVAEIHSDVSDIHAYVHHNQGALLAIVALAFLLVFCVLLGMVWYADRQIRRYNQLNLALAASYAQVQAASRAKSVFLGNISHELRTPLNAIIGFSEMIKDAAYGPLGSGKYLEFGRDIHASGLHLLAIINDVLDLVNADTGDAKVTYSSVDPAALAREVLELTAKKAKRAGVRMVLEAGAEPAPIRTDEAKLRQILLNLTDNAIDFTPSGGTVTIALQERAKAGELVLVVSDTGVGIKREDIPKALAPFSQLDESAARKREGTGLGLPLSKKFAELLGGSLHIDSRHGMGTRVSVVLPSRSVERRRAIVRPAA